MIIIHLVTAYMECVIYDGGVNIYHLDATTVRMSVNQKRGLCKF